MMLALATSVYLAAHGAAPATTLPAGFDLSKTSGRAISREEAAPREPAVPRNLDTRDFAVDMPELEVSLAEKGPVILLGAMGGRRGDTYKDMPKLAHVALGWSF